MQVTRSIAEFVSGAKFADFPPEALEVARRAMLDCTGVALAGTREQCSVTVAEWVREMGGNNDAGTPFRGLRTSPPAAALVWGTASHALDFDDVIDSLIGHPSVTLVPVVFSLARKVQAGGRKILDAYLVGLEVECKIGRGTSSTLYRDGWHATSTVGSLGAAAAAARMLNLDSRQTRMALGIAASMASGLRQNFGTMTKPLHAGLATRNGVEAAMLAARGFTADENILEAQFGFANVFSGPGGHDLSLALQGLGSKWEALDPGITVKKYPCCALTHRALDAVLTLRSEYALDSDQVDSVVCMVDQRSAMALIHVRPQTGLEGKFSMQYCVATALLDGKVEMTHFTDEAVAGSKARDLLARVTMEEHPETSEYTVVSIKVRDGQTRTARVDKPRGTAVNPLTWAELTDKYRECAGMVLPSGVVDETVDLFRGLENMESVVPLLDLLESAG